MENILFENLFNTSTFILNKRTGKSIPISYLCDIIIDKENITAISKELGIGRKVLSSRLREYISVYDTFNLKGNRTLLMVLLSINSMAKCNKCSDIKHYSEFYKIPTNISGIRYVCISCSKANRDTTYHRAYSKVHYINNKEYYYNKKAIRRSKQRTATTPFGQEGLNIFFKNRPKGMHIDHIVPLNHPKVCGLHNIYNLQYLTPEENLVKSNKFEV